MVSDEGKEFTLDTLSAPEVLASSFVFSTQRIFPVTIIAGSDCDLWVFSAGGSANSPCRPSLPG